VSFAVSGLTPSGSTVALVKTASVMKTHSLLADNKSFSWHVHTSRMQSFAMPSSNVFADAPPSSMKSSIVLLLTMLPRHSAVSCPNLDGPPVTPKGKCKYLKYPLPSMKKVMYGCELISIEMA
jgi:hypothetical protein